MTNSSTPVPVQGITNAISIAAGLGHNCAVLFALPFIAIRNMGKHSAMRRVSTRSQYLILDRDPLYTQVFRGMLKESGVNVVRLPTRSPNLNSYAERWIRSVRSECLSHVIPLSERHLRHLLSEYMLHFHQEGNHQGLDNRIIQPLASNANPSCSVVRRHERLGGVLNYYYREAA